MFCTYCGSRIDGSFAFCPNCGAQLPSGTPTSTAQGFSQTGQAPTAQGQPPYAQGQSPVMQQAPSKKSNGLMIAIIAIVAIAIIVTVALVGGGIAGVLPIGSSSDSSSASSAQSNDRSKGDDASSESSAGTSNGSSEAQPPSNPSSIDATKGPVELTGKVVRKQYTAADLQAGYSMVAYFLEFDSPISVTYNYVSGPTTKSLSRVMLGATEQYDSDTDKNLDTITIAEWQRYVDKTVTVSGKGIFDAGNIHYVAPLLQDAKVVESF